MRFMFSVRSFARSVAILALLTFFRPSSHAEEAKVPDKPPEKTPEAAPPKPDNAVEVKPELPTVVITAERTATSPEKTGVSTTVIDAHVEDDVRQVHDLGETLRQVPGLTVAQTGHQGDLTSLFTRGGNSNQTLILVDGFKVNRQGGEFNFGHFDPVRAERIEIARGPSSSLFGTDAVTGAVNVITEKGQGAPLITTSAAGGTFRTDRESVSLQGNEGKFSYNIGSARFNSARTDFINSGAEQYNYAARLDYDFNCDHTLKLIVRGTEFRKGFYENSASGYGPAVETQDPNDRLHDDDLLAGLEYRGHIVPIWTTTLRVGNYLLDTELVSQDPTPTSPIFGSPQSTGHTFARERRPSIDWQNDITAYSSIDESIKDVVTVGATYENEHFRQFDTVFGNNEDVSRFNTSVYFQNRLSLYDRAFITGGVRQEHNQQFGDFTTGRADAAILVPESHTRIHGSVGNAFRAPSFFEFFSSFGNPGLEPEKNFAYDAGVEQHLWKEKVALSVTAFRNNFRSLIDFSSDTNKFSNIKTAESEGLELEASIDPIKELTIKSTATFLHTEDQKGQELLRRPGQTFTAEAIGRPLSSLDLSLTFLHESSRADIGPVSGNSFARVRNEPYSRVDAAVTYRFFEHWRAFGRVQNMLNEHYQDVKTFPAPGANFLGGVEFHWKF
jgi:vitamin B12 transporter